MSTISLEIDDGSGIISDKSSCMEEDGRIILYSTSHIDTETGYILYYSTVGFAFYGNLSLKPGVFDGEIDQMLENSVCYDDDQIKTMRFIVSMDYSLRSVVKTGQPSIGRKECHSTAGQSVMTLKICYSTAVQSLMKLKICYSTVGQSSQEREMGHSTAGQFSILL